MTRCPLCADVNHTALHGYLRCRLCSLAFAADRPVLPPIGAFRTEDGTYRFPNWNSWRTRALRHLPSLPNRGSYFSPLAVRMFAAREGFRCLGLDSGLPLVPGHGPWVRGTVLRARLSPLARPAVPQPDQRVTLGVIAAANAGPQVLALWRDCAEVVAGIVVVLDTADDAKAETLQALLCEAGGTGRCRVLARLLANDYAAQRNRVQEAVTTPWVLQVDCDERLTPQTKTRLPDIIDEAEQAGWDVVGLTRRNMVDGVARALYPDVQYRLLRRSVAFTRAVHEYPVLNAGQRSFVHLGAGLIHALDGRRLAVRERRYEGIEEGAGRPHDTALLMEPLQAGVQVTP